MKYKLGSKSFDIIDLSGMTPQQWQEYRSSSIKIGGSEVGTILNLNPYTDALTLWAQKIGFVENSFTPSEATEGGHLDEDAIIRRLEHWDGNVWAANSASGKKFRSIEKPNITFIPDDAPYMALNVDGIITGDVDYPALMGVAEAKKINSLVSDRYAGGVPPYYMAQLCAYVHFLELSFGRIALLEDGVSLNVRTIDIGMAEYRTLVADFTRLPVFYRAVEEGRDLMHSDMSTDEKRSGVMDLIDKYSSVLLVTNRSKDTIGELRSESPYSVITTDSLDNVAGRIKEMEGQKKELETRIDTLKNKLRMAMEKAMAEKVVGKIYSITNKRYLTISRSKT